LTGASHRTYNQAIQNGTIQGLSLEQPQSYSAQSSFSLFDITTLNSSFHRQNHQPLVFAELPTPPTPAVLVPTSSTRPNFRKKYRYFSSLTQTSTPITVSSARQTLMQQFRHQLERHMGQDLQPTTTFSELAHLSFVTKFNCYTFIRWNFPPDYLGYEDPIWKSKPFSTRNPDKYTRILLSRAVKTYNSVHVKKLSMRKIEASKASRMQGFLDLNINWTPYVKFIKDHGHVKYKTQVKKETSDTESDEDTLHHLVTAAEGTSLHFPISLVQQNPYEEDLTQQGIESNPGPVTLCESLCACLFLATMCALSLRYLLDNYYHDIIKAFLNFYFCLFRVLASFLFWQKYASRSVLYVLYCTSIFSELYYLATFVKYTIRGTIFEMTRQANSFLKFMLAFWFGFAWVVLAVSCMFYVSSNLPFLYIRLLKSDFIEDLTKEGIEPNPGWPDDLPTSSGITAINKWLSKHFSIASHLKQVSTKKSLMELEKENEDIRQVKLFKKSISQPILYSQSKNAKNKVWSMKSTVGKPVDLPEKQIIDKVSASDPVIAKEIKTSFLHKNSCMTKVEEQFVSMSKAGGQNLDALTKQLAIFIVSRTRSQHYIFQCPINQLWELSLALAGKKRDTDADLVALYKWCCGQVKQWLYPSCVHPRDQAHCGWLVPLLVLSFPLDFYDNSDFVVYTKNFPQPIQNMLPCEDNERTYFTKYFILAFLLLIFFYVSPTNQVITELFSHHSIVRKFLLFVRNPISFTYNRFPFMFDLTTEGIEPNPGWIEIESINCQPITFKINPKAKVTFKGEYPADPLKTSKNTIHYGIGYSGYEPTVYANNVHNELIALQARVLASTPNPLEVSHYVSFMKKNHYKLMPNFKILLDDNSFEEYINTTNASVAVKKILRETHERLLAEGISYDSILTQQQLHKWTTRKSFIKVEKMNYRSPDGIKIKAPRMIQGASPEFIVLVGPFIMKLQARIKRHFHPNKHNWVFSSSLTNKQVADVINKPHCLHVEDDVSQWDVSVSQPLCELELFWAKKWGAPRAVLDLMRANIFTHGYTFHGFKYSVPGTRKSGDPYTTLFNTLQNMFTHVYIYVKHTGCTISDAKNSLFMVAAGDDNAISHQYQGQIDFKTYMFGLGFESKAIYKDLIDIEFCSNRLYHTSDGLVFGPKVGKVMGNLAYYVSPPLNIPPQSIVRGTALGLMNSCSFIPPLRSLLNRLLYLTEGFPEYQPRPEPWKMKYTKHDPVDETYSDLIRHYDLDQWHLRQIQIDLDFAELGESLDFLSSLYPIDTDTGGPKQFNYFNNTTPQIRKPLDLTRFGIEPNPGDHQITNTCRTRSLSSGMLQESYQLKSLWPLTFIFGQQTLSTCNTFITMNNHSPIEILKIRELLQQSQQQTDFIKSFLEFEQPIITMETIDAEIKRLKKLKVTLNEAQKPAPTKDLTQFGIEPNPGPARFIYDPFTKYAGPGYTGGKFVKKTRKKHFDVLPTNPFDILYRQHDLDYHNGVSEAEADRKFSDSVAATLLTANPLHPSATLGLLAAAGFRVKSELGLNYYPPQKKLVGIETNPGPATAQRRGVLANLQRNIAARKKKKLHGFIDNIIGDPYTDNVNRIRDSLKPSQPQPSIQPVNPRAANVPGHWGPYYGPNGEQYETKAQLDAVLAERAARRSRAEEIVEQHKRDFAEQLRVQREHQRKAEQERVTRANWDRDHPNRPLQTIPEITAGQNNTPISESPPSNNVDRISPAKDLTTQGVEPNPGPVAGYPRSISRKEIAKLPFKKKDRRPKHPAPKPVTYKIKPPKPQKTVPVREIPTFRTNKHTATWSENASRLNISGTHFLTSVSTGTASGGALVNPIVYSTPVQPYLFGDVVLEACDSFVKYRFKRLTIHYVATKSTATDGAIGMYYNSDPTQNISFGSSESLQAFFDAKGVMTPVYEKKSFTCKITGANKYVRMQTSLADFITGNFIVVGLPNTPASTTFGLLYADYELEFFQKRDCTRSLITAVKWSSNLLTTTTLPLSSGTRSGKLFLTDFLGDNNSTDINGNPLYISSYWGSQNPTATATVGINLEELTTIKATANSISNIMYFMPRSGWNNSYHVKWVMILSATPTDSLTVTGATFSVPNTGSFNINPNFSYQISPIYANATVGAYSNCSFSGQTDTGTAIALTPGTTPTKFLCQFDAYITTPAGIQATGSIPGISPCFQYLNTTTTPILEHCYIEIWTDPGNASGTVTPWTAVASSMPTSHLPYYWLNGEKVYEHSESIVNTTSETLHIDPESYSEDDFDLPTPPKKTYKK